MNFCNFNLVLILEWLYWLTPQPMRYAREPDAITAASRVTTRTRSSTRAAQALLWMRLAFARESHFAWLSIGEGGQKTAALL